MNPKFPRFDEFYAVINGYPPLPWQSRLARQVAEDGWPAEIGVETGLGKTSCLDIGVWALAAQGDRPPTERRLPTRLWYVVNRRLLVDAAYEHGRKLEQMLMAPGSSAIAAVANRLRAIAGFTGSSDTPLAITRLRGGTELGSRPPHPAQPSLLFATAPMFASSWLFRGYASSLSMRPVDAAHAGMDAVVLLDEAHLSRPLQQLQTPLQQCDIGQPSALLPDARQRTTIVTLTATGDADDPFLLDEDDHQHPIVRQRLDASKPTELRPVPRKAKQIAKDLTSALSDQLVAAHRPVAAVVFTNTPRRAREVLASIDTLARKRDSPLRDSDIQMLTGRMRTREADLMRDRILDPSSGAPSSRTSDTPRDRHLVVVATQTLEVGADLDFDVLVTETCGARALIQRFGRLNRLGTRSPAHGVIVHPTNEADWEVYGEEPAAVGDRLTDAAGAEGTVDMSPSRIGQVVGAPQDAPPAIGELLPAHIWEWAKTSAPPPGEAPVELFFEGFETLGPRVSVIWRALVPESGCRLVPSAHVDEGVDLPLHEVEDALQAGSREESPITRLRRDRVSVEQVPASALRPGDVVVLHTDDGLYDRYGWNPDTRESVLDVSLSRWPGLPLDTDALRNWAAGDALGELKPILDLLDNDDADVGELAEQALQIVRQFEPHPEVVSDWTTLLDELQPTIEISESVPMLVRRAERRKPRESMLVAADAFDDLSATATSETLGAHLQSVGEIAQRIAIAIGLPGDLVEAVSAAGRFHDLGKSDPRFQRWLDPMGNHEELLAKSSSPRSRWRADRELSGWPAGGRHEVLSVRVVDAWLATNTSEPSWDHDLVRHLVISHHGGGRPLVPPVDDKTAVEFNGTIEGTTVIASGDLAALDWDQPARFRRCCERYGYWGLALLEAIVRQADHLASAAAAGRTLEVA